MNYYAYYDYAGRLITKEETLSEVYSQGSVQLTEEEYNALDIEIEQEIFDLKKQLSDTDYIACKIAEGAATVSEYADELAQRQAWRDRINELNGNA